MKLTNVPRDFSTRYLNEGFSGGEKKRMEILQLALQKPEMAILDETDSGLDIDALRVVANGVNAVAGPDMGVLIITHYQRILHLVQPSHVHVMYQGRIVREGGPGAGRRARGQGLRRGSPTRSRRRPDDRGLGSSAGSVAVDGIAAAVPGPAEPAVRRAAGRVPGLGGDVADARSGDRRDDVVLHAAPRVDPPRRVSARRRGDRSVRGRPRRGSLRGSGRRPRRRSSRPTPPPRSTWSRTRGAARTCSAATSWC